MNCFPVEEMLSQVILVGSCLRTVGLCVAAPLETTEVSLGVFSHRRNTLPGTARAPEVAWEVLLGPPSGEGNCCSKNAKRHACLHLV